MNNNELAVNTSIEDIYGDNPLITQLPPILDTKSVIKHLRGKLKFIPEQRFLPQPERIHLIAQLPHDFFQPLNLECPAYNNTKCFLIHRSVQLVVEPIDIATACWRKHTIQK